MRNKKIPKMENQDIKVLRKSRNAVRCKKKPKVCRSFSGKKYACKCGVTFHSPLGLIDFHPR
ncbi:hypothetical protein A0128_17850 [Leptospira tipperaryensis]|uniref:Uncharacterized protein n=1 Tax=Leptospira tipperaryensis TaxID=2564040 RepID=A0A1D7V143_9LEPT|nr:hypothetical protein A0128_17850 [Leptospira tipperaryensis]